MAVSTGVSAREAGRAAAITPTKISQRYSCARFLVFRGVVRRRLSGGPVRARVSPRRTDAVYVQGFVHHGAIVVPRRSHAGGLRASATQALVVQHTENRSRERLGISGGASNPVTPSSTSSGMPPVRVATTGIPSTCASMIDVPKPSRYELMTNTSKARKRSSASSRKPVNTTAARSPAPARATPTPRATLLLRPGKSGHRRGARNTSAAARKRSFCALCGASAATFPTAKVLASSASSARTAARGLTSVELLEVDAAVHHTHARRRDTAVDQHVAHAFRNGDVRVGATAVLPAADESARDVEVDAPAHDVAGPRRNPTRATATAPCARDCVRVDDVECPARHGTARSAATPAQPSGVQRAGKRCASPVRSRASSPSGGAASVDRDALLHEAPTSGADALGPGRRAMSVLGVDHQHAQASGGARVLRVIAPSPLRR